jgi:hypothetical protein
VTTGTNSAGLRDLVQDRQRCFGIVTLQAADPHRILDTEALIAGTLRGLDVIEILGPADLTLTGLRRRQGRAA